VPHVTATAHAGVAAVIADLRELADPGVAAQLQRFFRTGPGEYGAGDRFLGVRVPLLRALARRHRTLAPDGCAELLRSPWHEARLLALLILVGAYQRATAAERGRIFDLYLASTAHINSWDLVDTSAEHIVGRHLRGGDTALLHRLAASASVWERRIAIVATFHFIKAGELAETFRIAQLLLGDDHHLIHKATGWMLREAGKRDASALERFLARHHAVMPRTMLRYAIERLEPAQRIRYLTRQARTG
jgi:3-methyladenine DNA glycosylase AlkD